MPALVDELRERRTALRAQLDEIITRAADDNDGRDLTADEFREHQQRAGELREVDDRIEQLRDDEIRQLRASLPAGPATPRGPLLTREQNVTDWCRGRGLLPDAAEHEPPNFGEYLRALAEGTQGAGGAVVPTPLAANVIDLARNQMRVMQAGAVTVPMTSQTLKIPRLLTEGSPTWRNENATLTDADMTFDSITFTARTVTRLIKLSVELFDDSDPSAGDIIARSFASQVALELDRVALRGSGTAPEPRGVLNQSGITTTTHGANGTAIGYDFLLDAAGAVRNANFEPNAHIVAPRSGTSLAKAKDTTGQYLAAPVGLLPIYQTRQVPVNLTVGTSTDCSEIYTADWSQLLIGVRTDLRLEFLRERFLADNLQYAFLAYARMDVQLAQPAAFVVDTGVRG